MISTPSLFLLTGGMGSGNTTTAQSLSRILFNMGYPVLTLSISTSIKAILLQIGFPKLPAASPTTNSANTFFEQIKSSLTQHQVESVEDFIELLAQAYKQVLSDYIPNELILSWKFKHTFLKLLEENQTLSAQLETFLQTVKTINKPTIADIQQYSNTWRMLAQYVGTTMKRVHTETIFSELYYIRLHNILLADTNLVIVTDDWRFEYEELNKLYETVLEYAALYIKPESLAKYYRELTRKLEKLKELLNVIRVRVNANDEARCKRLNIDCNKLRELSNHESEHYYKYLPVDFTIDNNADRISLHKQLQLFLRKLSEFQQV